MANCLRGLFYLTIPAVVVLFGFGFWAGTAFGASIPKAAYQHQRELTRAARLEFGLNAPVALLAAQIHTESRWDEKAVSFAGAEGLAQFMPATAKWLPEVAPQTGKPMPFNPAWALRAMCAYDKYLFDRLISVPTLYDRWAFTLAAYNGGLGWVWKDREKAREMGLAPDKYEAVKTVNAGRRLSAYTENRRYPEQIFGLQGLYGAWGAGVACD